MLAVGMRTLNSAFDTDELSINTSPAAVNTADPTACNSSTSNTHNGEGI